MYLNMSYIFLALTLHLSSAVENNVEENKRSWSPHQVYYTDFLLGNTLPQKYLYFLRGSKRGTTRSNDLKRAGRINLNRYMLDGRSLAHEHTKFILGKRSNHPSYENILGKRQQAQQYLDFENFILGKRSRSVHALYQPLEYDILQHKWSKKNLKDDFPNFVIGSHSDTNSKDFSPIQFYTNDLEKLFRNNNEVR